MTGNIRSFIQIASFCCLLSVLTTIGIHSDLFNLGALNFEARLLLFENPKYLLNRFWIIVHCLLVLLSMLGVFLIGFKKKPATAILGYTFFSVFVFAEIFRQMFVLFYLNNLRKLYLETTDQTIQTILSEEINHASLLGYSLFGLFIVAFALGNVCYAFCIYNSNKFDKILSVLLFVWGIGNLIAFANEFIQVEVIYKVLKHFNIIYQPLMRISLAIWLYLNFKRMRGTSSEDLEGIHS
ncbi:MAG: hypothetical protein AAFO07_32675 [Bacteroidota bacterium]